MNKKFVGKKAEPTSEELEFIHSLLGRLSDAEVLEEMQDTEFPVRSSGFIKRRRREYNAAKKVLADNTTKDAKYTSAESKEEEYPPEARNHDIKVFKKFDEIMNEQDFRSLDWQLQAGLHFSSTLLDKLEKFTHYLHFQSNQFVIKNLQDRWEYLRDSLVNLSDFTGTNFFSSPSLRYLELQEPQYYERPDVFTEEQQQEQHKEYRELSKELCRLAQETFECYLVFRAAVRGILFV
ncbi:hypothetical protein ACFLWZ_03330 [Chloroflexota bacterium]